MAEGRLNRGVYVAVVTLGSALGAICASCSHRTHDASVVAVPPGVLRPNIVLINCDDLGYGDLACYGNAQIRTPHLDQLAREGVRFTDFYAAQAVCSASRAALLTGCYPNRIGLLHALPPQSKIGIHENELTMGELLKSHGYATAIYGKWHLGDAPRFLPTRHGFDEYFGIPFSNDMVSRPAERPGPFPPHLPLFDGEKTIEEDPDQSQLTSRYTHRAVEFIEKHRKGPFFVYLAHTMPHVPLAASQEFRGRSAGGLYGDVIEEIDASVGTILETLRKFDLEQNTLVIFASDNGPWIHYGNHAGTTGPLREGKGTTFDGGVRVPCIVRWPGHVPAGTVCSEPLMTIDWMPTLAGITGATLDEGRIIDGRDIGPLLSGQSDAKSPHEALYFYWVESLEAVRSGRWKLHLPHRYRTLTGPAGKDGQAAPYEEGEIGLALYDLESDPGETTDIADSHPEVVAKLQALAQNGRDDLGDSATGAPGKNRRQPGKIE